MPATRKYPARKTLPGKNSAHKPGILVKLLSWTLWGALGGVLVATLSAFLIYAHYTRDLPSIRKLEDYKPPIVSSVYDRDGNLVAEFYRQRRIVIPVEKMPQLLVKAFIASEDAHFFEHPGIDFSGIIRAMIKNVQAGSIVQGGSTITQQVAKSLLLSPERSWKRKFREAILAYRIDKKLTKNQILFLYLNQIYLGHGAYGVEAAAQNYFGKHCWELTLPQCALLAGLPRAPSRYSPCNHPTEALKRRRYVLNRMSELGFISKEKATQAESASMDIKCEKNISPPLNYFTEEIRRKLIDKFGEDALYQDGLQVYTTVDSRLQKIAEKAIDEGLRELDKRQGYCGPLDQVKKADISQFIEKLKEDNPVEKMREGAILKAIILGTDAKKKSYTLSLGTNQALLPYNSFKWALHSKNPEICHWKPKSHKLHRFFRPGDVILVKIEKPLENLQSGTSIWLASLEQEPLVEGSLVSMETKTGYVRSLVGGRSFATSQFNRATQSLRQPGSSFKPIIYTAALDHGFNPLSVIIDSPIGFPDPSLEGFWKPHNYGKKFYGPTFFREALIHSRNIVTIKILLQIGINNAIEYARKLGITAPLSPTLSLALGASGVSLLEMTAAYSAFANLGEKVKPVMVTEILDRYGNILLKNEPHRERALSSDTAYIINHLLQEVILYGTGRRVRALNRPEAGKTGTSNKLRDAWFIGYTPDLLTGVWVGFDDEKYPLGKRETGAKAASPIWLAFMEKALHGTPITFFDAPPPGIILLRINPETGTMANPTDKNAIVEAFKEGNLPNTKKAEVTKEEEFFKNDLE